MKSQKRLRKIEIAVLAILLLVLCGVLFFSFCNVSSCFGQPVQEPITMEECGTIYRQNREDFHTVQNYVDSLNDDNMKITIDALTVKDGQVPAEVQESADRLKNARVKSVDIYNHNDVDYVIFYIDGTASSRYGILWRTDDRSEAKYALDEHKLEKNWYSYFIGFT